VRIASEVYLDWLPEHLLQERSSVNFDTRRKRVEFWTETLFFDLPVERVRQPDGDKLLAQAVLAKAALGDLEHALDLREKKLVRFLARLRCLRDWRPDLDIPAYDQQDWAGVLEQICPGKRSFAELRRVPLLPVVRDRLTWRQRQLLDELAPERWPLADGRSVRIQYQEGKPPVLAVRIQQLFGVTQTPCLAGGRVPIVVHLLAPNGRPQQVTQDLNSFWRNIYPRVRKELMHRYPKHAWPEDPFA
jgi:ATP-dependent helicase HrpB